MEATLNVTSKIIAFADQQQTNDPRLKYADWLRNISGVSVQDPKTEAHEIAPGQTVTVFNGVRTTAVGAGTEFSSTLSPLDPSRYRFTWTGGADPLIRTNRGLTLTGIAVTVTVLSNATVQISVPVGPDFTLVQVGDIIFIPNINTGDSASPFSVINSGYWSVLAKPSSTVLNLMRLPGTDFEGVSEVVTLTDNSQLRAFTATGVQVGDSVDISAGFSLPSLRSFEVVAVANDFFEVISTTPLAPESGIIPGTAGLVFYTDSVRFLYLEADQYCAIRLNGSSDNSQKVESMDPSNPDAPGIYMKWGPCWSLVVVNLTSTTLNISLIRAG